MNENPSARPGPVLVAGVVLGVGLGGFIDGILLHQVLQWHHMLSSVVVPMDVVTLKVNMFWDGLFHLVTWAATVTGILLLWRARKSADGPEAGRQLAGGLLMGWGLFNFAEGLIDHQILGVHHVNPGDHQLAWDLGFLASGLLLIGLGWMLAPGRPRPLPSRAVRPPSSPEAPGAVG